MLIEEISSAARLEGIREEWSRLFDLCAASPFQSPEWLIPWWRHLGGGDLLVLAAREAGRLTGLAPLFVWGTPPQPRQVSFVGTGITDYLDFLLDPECAAEAAHSLLSRVAALNGSWSRCVLDDVPAHSALVSTRVRALDRSVEAGSCCPVLRLPPSWDALLSGLRAPFRRSLRKASRALEEFGGFRIEEVDRSGLEQSRDALFELHRKRWARRGGRGVLDDERMLGFHSEAMPGMLERGRLRLYALFHGDRIAAVTYCLAHGRRTYAYLAGFDPDLEHCSPGAVTLAHAIRQAIGEGMTEFDFLRGREAYKYGWGAGDRTTVRVSFRHAANLQA